MRGLLGKKIGMTRIFDDFGNMVPVTVLEAGPCVVTHMKSFGVDGYDAVQVCYGEEKVENINKATLGHLKKVGDKGFRYFGEFHVSSPDDFKLGQVVP